MPLLGVYITQNSNIQTKYLLKYLDSIKSLATSSFGKRISGNYVSLLLIQVTNLVLPLVTFPYLIRVLGIDTFGLIMFAQTLCAVLYIFVDFGFSLSATRHISLLRTDKKEMARVFATVLSVKAVFATLLFISYLLVILIVPRFSVEKEIFILSYLMVIGQAFFVDWFFQGIEKMKVMALLSLLAKGVFTTLIFVFINTIADYTKVPLFMGLGYVLAGTLSIVLALKFTSFVKPDLALAKVLVKESFSLFISNLAARVINTIPVLILGFFVNDTTVGIYTSMEKLITTTKGIFVSLYQALYPWLVKQSLKKQQAYVKKMAPIIGVLAIVVMAPFFVFGAWVLDLLYNNSIINSYSYLLYILTVNIILSSYYMLFIAHYFPAKGDFISRLKILIMAAMISIIIGIICISQLEILGATLTAVITESTLVVLSIHYYLKTKSQGIHTVAT